MPDTADDAGADGMRVDRDGRLYVATHMGIQVCDQPGRVNAIIPTPNGRIANLCFGGPEFDILYATCGDRVYKRKVRSRARTPTRPRSSPRHHDCDPTEGGTRIMIATKIRTDPHPRILGLTLAVSAILVVFGTGRD